MKGKSASSVQFQARNWIFIPEQQTLGPRHTIRTSSQLSPISHQDRDKVDSAYRHLRHLTDPLLPQVEDSEASYRPSQYDSKPTIQPPHLVPESEELGPSDPIATQEGERQIYGTLAKTTKKTMDFIVQANQPSFIFQRFSSLPPITSSPRFPMTISILQSKETRKQGFKDSSPPLKRKGHHRNYHSAWYLPPTRWNLEKSHEGKDSTYSVQKGECHIAKAPYFYLHATQKVSHGHVQFQENVKKFQDNVKKFQRMPMMGKFKGHLEANNLRVPPFLQNVKSEREFEISLESDTVSSSEGKD